MILVPFGVLWGGYTLIWYGYSMLKGEGIGLADLVYPSRTTQADNKLATLGQPIDNPSNHTPVPGVGPGTGIIPPGSPANPSIPAVFNPGSGRVLA